MFLLIARELLIVYILYIKKNERKYMLNAIEHRCLLSYKICNCTLIEKLKRTRRSQRKKINLYGMILKCMSKFQGINFEH